MRKLQIIIVFSSLLFLTGCLEDVIGQREPIYDLREIKGEIYLVDRRNGQTLIRQGERLVELKRYTSADISKVTQVKKPVVMPVKGLRPELKIKYRDDQLLYEFEVRGQKIYKQNKEGRYEESDEFVDAAWEKYWEKDGNFLNLKLQDRDGFGVTTRSFVLAGLYKTSATKIVDEDDKVTGYRYEGVIPLSPERYAEIVSGWLTYSLEKPPSAAPLRR